MWQKRSWPVARGYACLPPAVNRWGRRERLPRQRALEAPVDWSYALLSENERRLVRLLSVFAGGFTLDAVAACWETNGTDGWEAVDLLSGLVDKSLVQPPDDEAAE